MNTNKEESYWTQRYHENRTGWDIGFPSTPLKEYTDQLTDKSISILIPGAGNAYEAEYLYRNGFKNVFVMDISLIPLQQFQKRNPEFPEEQLVMANFFKHQASYDLIIEQTFFCSFIPTDTNRYAYAKKAQELLKPKGKLVGLWFDIPLTGDMEKRPFGGNKEIYLNYFSPLFKVKTFEKAYNSIPERQGSELFGIFVKR